MAHIVIITHTFDDFAQRPYLAADLLLHWRAAGHRVSVVEGLENWPEADVALLHVDLSLVPEAYLLASRQYARVINGQALDIRKRVVSRNLVARDDDWTGPVIIKTDLNHGGLPEMYYFNRMRQAGRTPAFSQEGLVFCKEPYPVLESKAEVNPVMWNQSGVVVEKFLPERDPRGYWNRVWYFFGPAERCTRVLRNDPVAKVGDVLERQFVDVPEAIRAERMRLGFDYGKFDFVVNDGHAVLLDATRTPLALRQSPQANLQAQFAPLAEGLATWL